MTRRIVLILVVVWLDMIMSGAVVAATIAVDTANDEFNNDSDCSLREAVHAASNDIAFGGCDEGSGADVVTFAPAMAGRKITLLVGAVGEASGDIDISGGSLTIRGPVDGDPRSIVIDGSGSTRVFDVSAEAQVDFLRLINLTIQNGRVKGADARGGGIRVRSDNTRLSLDHVRVTGNVALATSGDAQGGGIYTSGSFSFSNTVISDNTARTTSPAATVAGGGLYAAFGDVSTNNSVRKVEISANTAISESGPAFGGGVYLAARLNDAPFVSTPIPNQSFQDPTADGASFNLTDIFSDPNGDVLSFQVSSVDSGVAGVAVNGVTLTVEPAGAGNTTVTVTADDQRGGTASTMFTVDVGAPNQPPNVTGSIPDQTIAPDDPPFTFDLEGVFTDPDNDPLTYSSSSANANVATTFVNGSTLTIQGAGHGTTTVSAAARDGNGGEATATTLVTVNSTPIVANAIPDQPENAATSPFTIDLADARDLSGPQPVFRDPDGDPLIYTASVTGDSRISATLNGDQLTVAVSDNVDASAVITVTASDGFGGAVSDLFDTSFYQVLLRRAGTPGMRPQAEAVSVDDGLAAYDVGNAAVQVIFSNTTISSNTVKVKGTSQAAGAGLYVLGAELGVGFNNVTISGNRVTSPAGTGGGVAVAGAEISLSNTIVAGNAASRGPDCVSLTSQRGGAGIVTSAGFNLVGNSSGCAFSGIAGDRIGTATAPVDARLAPLGDNGGSSRTHALLLNSPAIDAGNPATPGSVSSACKTTDQRGHTRPLDGDRSGTAECDIGAYEAATNQPPAVITAIPDQTLTAGADALAVDLSTIFFDPEGGVLRFSATSSNPAVVTVSVNGTILRVVAVSPGTAIVTVVAEDNLDASRSFRLAVSNGSGAAPGGAGGSGGGCTLATGPTAVDPMLWLLVLLAFGLRCRGYLRGDGKNS